LIVKYSEKSSLTMVHNVCRWANKSCELKCSLQKNCIKLSNIIRRGEVDRFPDNPGDHFLNWTPDIQRELDEFLTEGSGTEEETACVET
jgi:hypothetical protein